MNYLWGALGWRLDFINLKIGQEMTLPPEITKRQVNRMKMIKRRIFITSDTPNGLRVRRAG